MKIHFVRLNLFLVFCATLSTVNSDNGFVGKREEILDRAINAVEKISTNMTSAIPSFHHYLYDGHPYDIHNGGYDMYDGVANKVYHSDGEFTDVLFDYNVGYINYNYGVRSDHPLFGVMWILNKDMEYHTYRVQIEGYPGFGSQRSVYTSNGSVDINEVQIQYITFQVYELEMPTICEVYFILENSKWLSASPDDFEVMNFNKNASYLKNAVIMTGRPKNMIMGYMLLSNSNGKIVPEKEVEEVLKIAGNSVRNLDHNLRNFTEMALLAIEAEVGAIRGAVSDWYNYTYSMQEIQNGGEDMYGRRGNRIFFSDNGNIPTQVYYDLTYKQEKYEVTSRAIHPFIGMMWINDDATGNDNFTWEVSAYAGRNDNGVITLYNGSFSVSKTRIQYCVYSLSSVRGHPSICEVYFTLANEEWSSTVSHHVSLQTESSTEELKNTFTVSENPKNVLMGYMLLSKKNAMLVSEKEIVSSLTAVVNNLPKIDKAQPETFLNEAIQSVVEIADNITGVIKDWHDYLYDEGFYAISYEMNHMFTPWGNSMVFAEDLDHADYKRTNYDLYYSYNSTAVKCKTEHPFVCLMWIDSDEFEFFSFKIHSHVDLIGNESYVDYQGSFTSSGNIIEYFVFQLYNRSKPSICEVYFTLNNPERWSSQISSSHSGKRFERTTIQDNYIFLGGYIKKVFMGYMLLSKYPGIERITEDEIRSSLISIAESIDEVSIVCKEERVDHPFEGEATVTFPQSTADSVAYTQENCGNESPNAQQPLGSRVCSPEGEWEEPIWNESCFQVVETTTGSSNRLQVDISLVVIATTLYYNYI